MEFFGDNRMPKSWAKKPTDNEMRLCYETNLKWVKFELAYRLDEHYIADGYKVIMTEDEFEELAWDMDEQIDWCGMEYIGDWLSEELEKRGYIKEES